MTTIKITQLPSIGNNLSASTILPVVSTSGVSTTDRTTLGSMANYVLAEAGNLLPPAFVSTLAYSVVNAAQPNITSVGTLGINTLIISGGTNGQYIQTDGTGNLAWVSGGVGGSDTQIQFNNAGNFGGNTGFTFDKTIGILAAPFADVSGVANIVGGGATVATKSVLNVASTFGSNDANDPASAQAVRGRVTGANLTKTRNYVTGVTGQYLVTGTNASEFIKAGILGVVGDQTTTADGAVVAYLDGDGGLTTANAAYAVSMKNSTPNSGFNYGLDLQFINLNLGGVTTSTFKQADIRFNNGVKLVANTANNISINANVTVGTLTLPGGGYSGDYYDISSANGISIVSQGDSTRLSWVRPGATPIGNISDSTAFLDDTGISLTFTSHVAEGSYSDTLWKFGQDGSLTLPFEGPIVSNGSINIETGPYYIYGITGFNGGGADVQISLDDLDTIVSIGDNITDGSGATYQVTAITGTNPEWTITTSWVSPDPYLNAPYSFSKPGITGGTWQFGTDGTTTFPTANIDLHNGGVQSGEVLQFGNSSQQAIITGPTPDANVSAQRLIIQGQRGNGTGEGGDVYVWGGDADTNGGDIKIYAGDADNVSTGSGGYVNLAGGDGFDNGGAIDITGGSSANGTGGAVYIDAGTGELDGGTVTIQAGYGVTGQGGTVQITGGLSGNGTGSYGNVVLGSGSIQWIFDNTGNLTLPANTFAVNYANGTQVSIGGGANTGNVTFDDNIVIGTGTQDGGSGLYLAPGTESVGNLQYLRVRGGDYITHIHLDTGNNAYFDQYFGADSRFVKLEANGNVVINADDYAGNGASWTFGTDGNLTLPGNLIIAGNTSVFGTDAALIQPADGLPLLAISSGANGAVSSLWVEDIGNVGTSNIAAVYANPTSGSKIVRIAVGQNGGGGPNLWDFSANGALTLPYGARIRDTAGNAVAFGRDAAATGPQGNAAVAIGQQAGDTSQGQSAVAIGMQAGLNTQGINAVAIGTNAGNNNQGGGAVSIGYHSGEIQQGTGAIAVGADAGANAQGNYAVAVGLQAGDDAQGTYAVAVGFSAGRTSQGNNSIIINATGANLDQTTANTFTVKPVRGDSTANLTGAGFKGVYYNPTTGEFCYSTD